MSTYLQLEKFFRYMLKGKGEDLSNGVARVKREGMAKSLLAVSDSDDSLTFPVPGEIIDFPTNNSGFALQRHIAAYCIPYSHRASDV